MSNEKKTTNVTFVPLTQIFGVQFGPGFPSGFTMPAPGQPGGFNSSHGTQFPASQNTRASKYNTFMQPDTSGPWPSASDPVTDAPWLKTDSSQPQPKQTNPNNTWPSSKPLFNAEANSRTTSSSSTLYDGRSQNYKTDTAPADAEQVDVKLSSSVSSSTSATSSTADHAQQQGTHPKRQWPNDTHSSDNSTTPNDDVVVKLKIEFPPKSNNWIVIEQKGLQKGDNTFEIPDENNKAIKHHYTVNLVVEPRFYSNVANPLLCDYVRTSVDLKNYNNQRQQQPSSTQKPAPNEGASQTEKNISNTTYSCIPETGKKFDPYEGAPQPQAAKSSSGTSYSSTQQNHKRFNPYEGAPQNTKNSTYSSTPRERYDARNDSASKSPESKSNNSSSPRTQSSTNRSNSHNTTHYCKFEKEGTGGTNSSSSYNIQYQDRNGVSKFAIISNVIKGVNHIALKDSTNPNILHIHRLELSIDPNIPGLKVPTFCRYVTSYDTKAKAFVDIPCNFSNGTKPRSYSMPGYTPYGAYTNTSSEKQRQRSQSYSYNHSTGTNDYYGWSWRSNGQQYTNTDQQGTGGFYQKYQHANSGYNSGTQNTKATYAPTPMSPREILGLSSEQLTEDLINNAYRKKSLQYHPDKHVNSSAVEKAKAEKMFNKLNEAKEMLIKEVNKPQNTTRWF